MEIPNFDKIIMAYVVGSNVYLNYFFTIISYSVYAYIIFAIVYFLKKKNMRGFFLYTSNLLIGLGIITFLKYTIARPRPFQILREDPSFPSRHSFVSMFTLTSLYDHFHKIARLMLIIYSLLILAGRLYLGVHYPSDVMIGSLLGVIFPKLIPQKFSFWVFNLICNFLKTIKKVLIKIKNIIHVG